MPALSRFVQPVEVGSAVGCRLLHQNGGRDQRGLPCVDEGIGRRRRVESANDDIVHDLNPIQDRIGRAR